MTDEERRERIKVISKQIRCLLLERARLQDKLAAQQTEYAYKEPRYDDVFFDGVEWLDSL